MSRKNITISILSLIGVNVFLLSYILNPSGEALSGRLIDKFDGSANEAPAEKNKESASRVSNHEAISPVMSGNSVIYYEKGTGRVFKTSLETNTTETISESILRDFLSAVWAPDKRQVIAKFYGPLGNEFRYYSYDTKKTIPLDRNVRSAVFSPNSSQIAYFKSTPEGGEIYISNPDGSDSHRIFKTAFLDTDLKWLADDLIVVSAINSADQLHYVFSLNRDGEIRKIFDGLMKLDTAWRGDGAAVIYSSFDNGSLESRILNLNTGTEVKISKNIAAGQCSWGTNSVVCVSRQDGGSGDEIFLINPQGDIISLTKTSQSFNPSEVMLSPDESRLIILNRPDNLIYSLRINQ
ncbi:MAG: hypothetical protein A3G02_03285 [Candidatus Yanofskybacteria bacterium RIFCSPLOWO2_12_FULL_44_13b]|uniref:Protein TolB n=3 Tax=Parcubacteria group TaxID=1794811 RepID=A0A0G0XJT3_9BACT|nr:MAG: hypothetical protein UU85_C0006G0002 [Candidatus Wolfebacteria bacterium GW2011_GWA2_42_10]KKT90155.1 MAG: hypothetical protein UW90_C0005G0010 [Candidatus Yanofskybacteria bacterium GW2011_GWB1_45_11]OGN03412.1 MAG: hypothetical protein A2657_00555 [Candidatus Yanofskybacteria bacterium RIFCSPHIGHO2_01_FULL_44_110b]OGN15013.1 MAG: hypothetical protein A3C01_02790 [Candidatus Yanofskybacteria bacterium RIFCSPHIGHO2_02_FULL_44_36b]OGN18944.1 MAG: hypothetical protein A3F50_01275 [Candida